MKEPLYSDKGEDILLQKEGKKGVTGKLKAEEKRFLIKLALGIRKLRIAAGVTQEEFYKDTNIHIGRIETGNVNISINTLYRICNYFKISVKDFFRGVTKR